MYLTVLLVPASQALNNQMIEIIKRERVVLTIQESGRLMY